MNGKKDCRNGEDDQDAMPIPQRRPSSNLTELLQNANGSNPSTPNVSRHNSLIVRSQQNSFECRIEDEEITNFDPKEIAQLVSSTSNMQMNETEQNGKGENGKTDEGNKDTYS